MQRPILVVDDDAGVRTFVRRVLEHCGYPVAMAEHARHALEILAGLNGAIRLLLTDVRMPGLSGVELLRRVRTLWPELPCLFMTGYADETWAVEALALACPVLRKPFTMDELEAAVARALRQD
jgi:DNA-binding NtrC family response regulator